MVIIRDNSDYIRGHHYISILVWGEANAMGHDCEAANCPNLQAKKKKKYFASVPNNLVKAQGLKATAMPELLDCAHTPDSCKTPNNHFGSFPK